MSFTLKVEFSGLCVYLIHENGSEIGILMPDCRLGGHQVHLDGTPSQPHVGYLQYDLADAGVALPFKSPLRGPQYEGIHRFNFEELDFGLPKDLPPTSVALYLPEVGKYAPSLQPIPDLFAPKPPKTLLMRTIIKGGSLTSSPEDADWVFSRKLNPGGSTYRGQFAGHSTWTREIEADHIVVRVNPWGDDESATLTLKPARKDNTVRLKVANLCADNPLEWPELKLRTLKGRRDDDFKWMYRLLRPVQGSYSTHLGVNGKLPVPTLVGKMETVGGLTDCTGKQIKVASF